jgi:hypothetical protein
MEERYKRSVHAYKNRMKAYLLGDLRAQSAEHKIFNYYFGTATSAEKAAVALLKDELELEHGLKAESVELDLDDYDVTRLVVRVKIQ